MHAINYKLNHDSTSVDCPLQITGVISAMFKTRHNFWSHVLIGPLPTDLLLFDCHGMIFWIFDYHLCWGLINDCWCICDGSYPSEQVTTWPFPQSQFRFFFYSPSKVKCWSTNTATYQHKLNIHVGIYIYVTVYVNTFTYAYSSSLKITDLIG